MNIFKIYFNKRNKDIYISINIFAIIFSILFYFMEFHFPFWIINSFMWFLGLNGIGMFMAYSDYKKIKTIKEKNVDFLKVSMEQSKIELLSLILKKESVPYDIRAAFDKYMNCRYEYLVNKKENNL